MGIPKKITDPNVFWEWFMKYVEFQLNNPIKKHTFVGKDGHPDYVLIERPITFEGFSLFLEEQGTMSCSSAYDYYNNYRGAYDIFSPICKRIKGYIRTKQIEMGLAGVYNASITQRLNGLVDKVEQTHIEQPLLGKLDDTTNNID